MKIAKGPIWCHEVHLQGQGTVGRDDPRIMHEEVGYPASNFAIDSEAKVLAHEQFVLSK